MEVGANSTIDRGSAQDTVIGAGSRLDNLVQIGHNVRLGRCCVIVAQAGISGSTVVEDFVMIGGQAGLAGHLRDRPQGAARGAGRASWRMCPAGADVVGSPAMPVREFFRQVATLRRLAARRGSAAEASGAGGAGLSRHGQHPSDARSARRGRGGPARTRWARWTSRASCTRSRIAIRS